MKIKILLIVSLFIPLSLFAQGTLPKVISENEKLMDALRRNNSVIQLQVINASGDQVTGSAFITDVFETKKGLMVTGLTAGHVANAPLQAGIVLNGKNEEAKAMIRVSPDSFQIHKKFNPKKFDQYDVARFSFLITPEKQIQLKKNSFVLPVALELAKDPLKKEGVPLITAGYPLGASPLVGVSNSGRLRTNGIISVVCANEDISPMIPGMSGGPVFDREGRVIGINSYVDKKVGFCVPVSSEAVLDILGKNK